MTSFSQCSSAQKLQKEAPDSIGNAYFQKWVSGLKGGGSGINLYIPIEGNFNKTIELDSVYFRGKVTKLVVKPSNPSLYVGRFSSNRSHKGDVIMSDKPHAEYGNELPKYATKIPFELKDNECVVSFKDDNITKYFKIENVIEKQPLYYPKTKPKPKYP